MFSRLACHLFFSPIIFEGLLFVYLKFFIIGDYNEYFGLNTDTEAYVYLMLANNLLHNLSSEMITVAEDVSGMPAICRPVDEGQLGYYFSFSKSIHDYN